MLNWMMALMHHLWEIFVLLKKSLLEMMKDCGFLSSLKKIERYNNAYFYS